MKPYTENNAILPVGRPVDVLFPAGKRAEYRRQSDFLQRLSAACRRSVRIEETNTGIVTGSDGRYSFDRLEPKHYTLVFSFTGMKNETKTADFSTGKAKTVNICMEEDITSLDEVTVEARRERKTLKEAREQGVPVSVIDGKLLAGRGTSIAEVINHQTGVKIRRTGNTGNDTKINVRGLECNRVQIYMDGYALNTPDSSFNINDIPFYYEGGYTDEYYYGYSLTPTQNYVIPRSVIHTLGAEYAILNRRILFSLECHNIFNTRELTNLNYPLAGRTIQAKVRFTTLKW